MGPGKKSLLLSGLTNTLCTLLLLKVQIKVCHFNYTYFNETTTFQKQSICTGGKVIRNKSDACSWLCTRVVNSRWTISIKWGKIVLSSQLVSQSTDSSCPSHTPASHSQGEGTLPLAGVSLCLHSTSHPQKGGTKPEASSDEDDLVGAFPIYGISHSHSLTLAVGSQTACSRAGSAHSHTTCSEGCSQLGMIPAVTRQHTEMQSAQGKCSAHFLTSEQSSHFNCFKFRIRILTKTASW